VTDAAALPLFRVVRGDLTAAETAALVAALALYRAAAVRRAADAAAAGHRRTGGRPSWADRSRLSSAPLPRGPGAWRASALPR